jgi:membrane fusion protein, multidrug efflux system
MARSQMDSLVRFLRRVAGSEGRGEHTDVQLLHRFAVQRDPDAFAALVERHGPMVLGVCRRVLHDANDADDAFQATFLVLVRKAHSLARPHLLANWLYGVARRTALAAKVRKAKQHAKERPVVDRAVADSTAAAVWADLRPVLDEEVGRLPERYRVPFVLCYLEGRTNEEAARLLDCPKGTVLSRLAWARKRLRARLTRRGLAPSAGLFAAALTYNATSAATVSPALVGGTTRAALAFAGSASPAGFLTAEVVALANGVLKHMFWTQMRYAALLLLVLSLVGGAGVLAWSSPQGRQNGAKPAASRNEIPPGAVQLAAEPKPAEAADAQEIVVGQPLSKQVTDYQDLTGRAEAASSVEIRARATGYLNKVLVKDGAKVKQGDALFEIDPRPYQAELDKATAALAQSEVRVQAAGTALQLATKLFQQAAIGIGPGEVDKATSAVAEAKAGVAVAKAVHDLARLNLSFATVTAPISGSIGLRSLDPGNLVKADDTILATLSTRNPMLVYFDIDERTALQLLRERGKSDAKELAEQTVEMGLADEKDFPHRGKLEAADLRVNPRTGTLPMRAAFPNPDGLLMPGLFCRVRLAVGKPYTALLVPVQAIGSEEKRGFVYVVNANNVVERRWVELGPRQGDLLVVKSGLKAQDWVVLGDLQKVQPSKTVKPRKVAVLEEKPPSAPGKEQP